MNGMNAPRPDLDPGLLIASLRTSGADRFDPVRFRFLEALSRRALEHEGEVRRILEARLAAALTAFSERTELAKGDADETITRTAERHCTSLAELTRHLAQHAPENVEASPDGSIGSRAELKTMRYFRDTWSKLSVDQQMTQALEQGPENAGPLNSHLLVLRAFSALRDISPDYLVRFMSYVDALLWLDQADQKSKPMVKNAADSEGDKKRKGARARSR